MSQANSVKTAVVIPCYKVAGHIKDVISSIPETIDHIVVVDDKCPRSSGKEAEELNRRNVTVVYHEKNLGVGGAVMTGYRKAVELGAEIIVKMDGDGQMDPAYMDGLIKPLKEDRADYAKGNRFGNFEQVKGMPKTRLLGNSALSFLVKVASGYWDVIDPTNGYTAIHKRVLEELDLKKISKRYFFESDMLINLNIVGAVVKDVRMPARYGEESSSLSIWKALFQFPPRLAKGLIKRIALKYFVYDFNMASVYLLIGLPMFVFSVVFGIWEWVDSIVTGAPKSAGTIMLVALPIIVSFQMLLQAVNIDINSVPRKNKS